MRLKICDSHLTCKVANKCLNVRERVEVVEWKKKMVPSLPLRSCELSVSVKENPDRKKQKTKNKKNSITVIGHGPVEMRELSWHKPIHVGNYKQPFAAEYSFWCQPLQKERVFLLRHRLIFTLHKQQKGCGCHMNHITTYELAILRGD